MILQINFVLVIVHLALCSSDYDEFVRGTSGLQLSPSCQPYNDTLLAALTTMAYLADASVNASITPDKPPFSLFLSPKKDQNLALAVFSRFQISSVGLSPPLIMLTCDQTRQCMDYPTMNGYSMESYDPKLGRAASLKYGIHLCPAMIKKVEAQRRGRLLSLPHPSDPEFHDNWDLEFCDSSPGWYDRNLAMVIMHEMTHFLSFMDGVDVRDDGGYSLGACLNTAKRGKGRFNAQNWVFVGGYAVREKVVKSGRCGYLTSWLSKIRGGRLGQDLRGHPMVQLPETEGGEDRQELRKLLQWDLGRGG